MYPEEFKAERECAAEIQKKSTIDLQDIQKLLQAKNNIHLAINYGRADYELHTALNLSSSEGREAAARIFARDRAVYLIAQSNAQKTAHLNTSSSDSGKSSNYLETIDRILALLAH